MLPSLISHVGFTRSMVWTSAQGLRFTPASRWLVALFDGRVVEFELGGVRSGRTTRGHRSLANRSLSVKGLADYRRRLGQVGVGVAPGGRRGGMRQDEHAV